MTWMQEVVGGIPRIRQTGPEASLDNLFDVSLVVEVTINGKSFANIGANQLIVNDDFGFNPDFQGVIFGNTVAADSLIFANGANLNIGIEEIINGATRFSRGLGFVFNKTVGGSNDEIYDIRIQTGCVGTIRGCLIEGNQNILIEPDVDIDICDVETNGVGSNFSRLISRSSLIDVDDIIVNGTIRLDLGRNPRSLNNLRSRYSNQGGIQVLSSVNPNGSDDRYRINQYNPVGNNFAGDAFGSPRLEVRNVPANVAHTFTHNRVLAGDPTPITIRTKDVVLSVSEAGTGNAIEGARYVIRDSNNGDRGPNQDYGWRGTTDTINIFEDREYTGVTNSEGKSDTISVLTMTAREGQSAGGVFGAVNANWTGQALPIISYRGEIPDGVTAEERDRIGLEAHMPVEVRSYRHISRTDDVLFSGIEDPKEIVEELIVDTFVTEQDTSLVSAYTGIAVDHDTETITVTENRTLNELYDFLKLNQSSSDVVEFVTTSGVTMSITYNLVGLEFLQTTSIFNRVVSTQEITTPDTLRDSSISWEDTRGVAVVITGINPDGLPWGQSAPFTGRGRAQWALVPAGADVPNRFNAGTDPDGNPDFSVETIWNRKNLPDTGDMVIIKVPVTDRTQDFLYQQRGAGQFFLDESLRVAQDREYPLQGRSNHFTFRRNIGNGFSADVNVQSIRDGEGNPILLSETFRQDSIDAITLANRTATLFRGTASETTTTTAQLNFENLDAETLDISYEESIIATENILLSNLDITGNPETDIWLPATRALQNQERNGYLISPESVTTFFMTEASIGNILLTFGWRYTSDAPSLDVDRGVAFDRVVTLSTEGASLQVIDNTNILNSVASASIVNAITESETLSEVRDNSRISANNTDLVFAQNQSVLLNPAIGGGGGGGGGSLSVTNFLSDTFNYNSDRTQFTSFYGFFEGDEAPAGDSPNTRIRREIYTIDSEGCISDPIVTRAGGSNNFDQVWDDRLTLPYS